MGSRLQHRRPADPDADGPHRGTLRTPLPGTRKLNTPTDTAASACSASPAPAPWLLRGWRFARLALHLLEGTLTLACIAPLVAPSTVLRLRQRWSTRLLAILGIELQIGSQPVVPGSLLVANHVSWVDIFVINALAPAAFISKAEVRRWPVIGWLAAKSETVFLRRGSRGHAREVNAEIAALLDAGRNVAVFPEGTTTDGSHVLGFHAALLQPAIAAGHPVQPVALSYHGGDGCPSRAPAYDGDVSLGQSLAAIIAERRLVARIQPAAQLPIDEASDRRKLAQQAREAIVCLALGNGGAACEGRAFEHGRGGDAVSPGPGILRHPPPAVR